MYSIANIFRDIAASLCAAKTPSLFIQLADILLLCLAAFPWISDVALTPGLVGTLRRILTLSPMSKKDAVVYRKCEEILFTILRNVSRDDKGDIYDMICDMLTCEQRTAASSSAAQLLKSFHTSKSLPSESLSILALSHHENDVHCKYEDVISKLLSNKKYKQKPSKKIVPWAML